MTMVSPARDWTASDTVMALAANSLMDSSAKRAVGEDNGYEVEEMVRDGTFWMEKALIAPIDRRIPKFLSFILEAELRVV